VAQHIDKWWSTIDSLKRVGIAHALEGVRLVPNGSEAQIDLGKARELGAQHDDIRRICVWAAEWSRLWFPTVQMAHRYAAALMCTGVPAIEDAEIKPPWPFFLGYRPIT
jgi:hypothetical protein